VRTAWRWLIPFFLAVVLYALHVAWGDARYPGRTGLRTALARSHDGASLRTLAEAWSLAAPDEPVEIGSWRFRLALRNTEAARPAHGEFVCFRFVSFAENPRVERAWPNGVFYDWDVLARPLSPLARWRAPKPGGPSRQTSRRRSTARAISARVPSAWCGP